MLEWYRTGHNYKDIGYRWYDTADIDPFDMIFLQDRTEDTYLEKRIE
jgi:hypothetical protein